MFHNLQTMKCPVCKTDMIILELEQVETDYCTFCKGIWLDAGELELLLEGAAAKDELLKSLHPATNCREAPRSCPRCNKKMNKVFMGNNEEVLLDSCRKGHGLWFDAGELQEVVKLASSGQQTKMMQLLHDMFEYTMKK